MTDLIQHSDVNIGPASYQDLAKDDDELWRAVPDWPKYEVSDQGRVRRAGRILKPVPVQSGSTKRYMVLCVSLSNGPKIWSVKIAYLVLITFKGFPKKGKIIRHYDDIQSNNRLSNLFWGTHKQNGEDRARNGLSKRGSSNGNSTLTEAKVRQIKTLYKYRSKTFGVVPLSKRFKVCHSTISNIVRGKIWRHVT